MKTIAAAAKAAARNKTVRRMAAPAALAAARHVGPLAQQRYGEWRDRRVYKDRAVKLARQIGGRISEDTIIKGEPHIVVWKDGTAVEAFPHVDNLAKRPELAGFDPAMTQAPPQPRARRLPGRGA